jgi:serine/threonine-protein kinase
LNKRALWHSDRLIGLVVALLCVGAYLAGLSPVTRLERGAYDIGVAASIKPASSQIDIIAIDQASIDRIGRWPWPDAEIAALVSRLSAAGVRQIGLDIPLPAHPGTTARDADDDARLVAAVRHAGHVVLPMRFDFHAAGASPAPPAWLPRTAASGGVAATPLQAVGLRLPFDALAAAAAALGHVNLRPDPDGVVRKAPMLIAYRGHDYPSLPLAMAAVQLRHASRDLRIVPGPQIALGGLRIPTDAQLRARPFFHTSGRRGGFRHYAFADVMAGKIPPALFWGKTVLVGITAKGIGQTVRTPVSDRMFAVEFDANMLQSILHTGFFTHPLWARVLELVILALVAIYLIAVLPRLGPGNAAVTTILLLLALLSLNFFALSTVAIWIRTLTASAMLVLGHVLLVAKRRLPAAPETSPALAETTAPHKMLGLSFQSQGMLEAAFDKFRRCPLDADMLAILYRLAMDFERKRQFDKALDVYAHMATHDAGYKDIQARMQRARQQGTASPASSGMPTLSITGGTKPALGRYEIIKVLGKGAMGTVYLGRDPKINREVAIKTLALSEEFEADELEEVKARFFREAETAGRLMHPNIVTIFDAGEARDLAYIAMEYLNGTDLSPFTKRERQLPAAAVLKITGKVAEALHYAHQQGVIHRDIKPANIMLLRDKTVKVTDFGIARITASSKTKTGVVLGTPSYMSPEQLSGKHVDSRSDLFSLGIMLYELLVGARPFRGDSMSALMFQIANAPHPDIRVHNPALPERVGVLIDRLLAKTPERRPASGAEVVRAIVACLKDLKATAGGA